jgi:hypothetical protein
MATEPARLSGVQLIDAERMRQIEREGYTPDHDDRYISSALALAGACYALHAAGRLDAQAHWPFDEEWWKPSAGDPIRDLTKAGALIAAEIDRLQRLVGG